MARDAKENFFGKLKITPPRANFPPEMDKVTWWGRFKAFEFWASPEFQADWVNPQGDRVASQRFRGGRCELAKTALPVNNIPAGRLEPGTWRVVVTCDNVTIDNHPFTVAGSSNPVDARGGDAGIMIWADDVKDAK